MPLVIKYYGLHMSTKKTLLALSFTILIAIVWLFYAQPYDPPRDYPPLPDEERQRMDLKLFNELSVVNTAWPPRKTFEMRQQLILDMAKQGFEVADLAYQLLDINPGISSGRHMLMPWEWGTYRHLRILADKGDPSAQCLAALVISRWNLNMRDYEKYVIAAYKAGHPFCTFLMSAIINSPPKPWQQIPVDVRKSEKLRVLAAKKGVQWVQLYLMSSYAQGINGYPLNIGKAKCWFTLAEEANTGATLTEKSYLTRHIQQAQEKGFNVSEQYDPKQWCESELHQH